LLEFIVPAAEAISQFEESGGWRIDAYYEALPDAAAIAEALAAMLDIAPPLVVAEGVPDENWVEISQAALPPVRAGGFTVHGSHDKTTVVQGPNAILIDAGEAFGTAHHATTEGCLIAIDHACRARRYERILDLGCGTGVLAIACARRLPHAQLVASDIDPEAVRVAYANSRANRVHRRLSFHTVAGVPGPRATAGKPFDLIVANILAGPLIELAPKLRAASKAGGTVILSGILNDQSKAVIARYRAHGFALVLHDRIAGWSTLTLVRR
jgi:ribosomal protein L11 methyltransferase